MNSLDLKYYFAVFWRRLPWFLIAAGLVTGLGIAVAVLLPPTYRSSASILVESQQITENLANPTVQVDPIEIIQVIEQRLMTRANMLDIADRFDVFARAGALSPSEKVARMRAATAFEQTLSGTARQPGANAFTIGFEHRNPLLASEVTNEMVTLILQENATIRTQRATNTSEFFAAQVDELGRELSEIETRILDFKTANKDALPDSLEFRRDQLGLLQERLVGIEREEAALTDQIGLLEAALENPDNATLSSTAPETPLEREIDQLERELIQQGAVFSDTNPRIVALKSRLEALRAAAAATPPAETGDAAGAGLAAAEETDPERARIRAQIVQLGDRLGGLKLARAAIGREMAALEATILATPGNEMQLAVFSRNYETLTEQYNTARQKLAAATQGERIELQRQGERFSVIEQATPPDEPVSPNRPAIAAGAAVAGLAAGLGLILALELLNPAVRRPVEITRKLDIPVFETVPLIRTAGERRRHAALWTLTGAAVALAVAAATWAVDSYYLPLDLILNKIRDVSGLGAILNR